MIDLLKFIHILSAYLSKKINIFVTNCYKNVDFKIFYNYILIVFITLRNVVPIKNLRRQPEVVKKETSARQTFSKSVK